MEGAVRIVDSEACHIDYRLNLLGVRVRDKDCQLIARGNGSWEPKGPKWELPVNILARPDILPADNAVQLPPDSTAKRSKRAWSGAALRSRATAQVLLDSRSTESWLCEARTGSVRVPIRRGRTAAARRHCDL